MDLLIKAIIGAVVVLVMSYLAKGKNYYLVGLVPLFPTFALVGHIIVGKERSTEALRETIIFGMWSLIPYLVYLVALYFLVGKVPLFVSLLISILAWSLAAIILIKTAT